MARRCSNGAMRRVPGTSATWHRMFNCWMERYGRTSRVSRTKYSSEAVISAAEMTGVHDLIVSLPDGYDTVVGHHGVTLSAGQKQRIGLARAVFGRPFLIILDEPNAHLDREGELALAVTLRDLRAAGSVLIVAAHRTSVLSEVNKMLLLEEGRPGVFGSKEEMLAHLAAGARKQQERGLHVVSA